MAALTQTNKPMPLWGIDLFAGAGGMSIGAKMAGVNVLYAIENDRNAAATYSYNHPETILIERDIKKVSKSDFVGLKGKRPLVLFGGPPCQGFSVSNQKTRNKNNASNWLYKEYFRIVHAIKPDWAVFENVKGILETEKGLFFEIVTKEFKKIGYKTKWFILNACDYGIPQRRSRLFIIGSLHENEIDFKHETKAKMISVKEALEDLPSLENGCREECMPYKRIAQSSYAKYLRNGSRVCWNNSVSNNAPSIMERYKHIGQGENWESVPSTLMTNYKDQTRCHTGIYFRLKETEPSIVVGNYRKNMLIHPWEDRGLSVREAARLQSFPDDFRFLGSIGFQQQQVGNAVPPLLAKTIFGEIAKWCY